MPVWLQGLFICGKTGNLLWPYVDTHYTHFRNEKSGEIFFDKLKCIPLIIGLNYFL